MWWLSAISVCVAIIIRNFIFRRIINLITLYYTFGVLNFYKFRSLPLLLVNFSFSLFIIKIIHNRSRSMINSASVFTMYFHFLLSEIHTIRGCVMFGGYCYRIHRDLFDAFRIIFFVIHRISIYDVWRIPPVTSSYDDDDDYDNSNNSD